MVHWLSRWRTLAFGVSCLLHAGLISVLVLAEQWSLVAYASKPPVLPVELVTLDAAPALEPQPEKIERSRRNPPRSLRLPKPIVTPVPQPVETTSETPPPASVPVPAAPAVVNEAPVPTPAPGPVSASVAGPEPSAVVPSAPSIGPSAGSTAPASSVASAPSRDSGATGAVTRFARPQGGYQVRPTYPSSARRLGVQGTTVLKVYVHVDGRVGDVIVQESAGHPDLDQASVDAVRRWRFEPARRGDDPVAMWVLLPVEFRLR